jgi:hypothetical protein
MGSQRSDSTTASLSARSTPKPAHPPGLFPVGISWSLPGGSRAELTWTASVDPFADNRSLLSSSLEAGANDANGRRRLLAAWPSIGRVFESLTARLFRSVAELADLLADSTEPREISRGIAA